MGAVDEPFNRIPDENAPETKPHKVGYARISMGDQSLQRQRDALLEAGVPERDIYEDIATGANMDRRGWQDCIRDLRRGDILVIHDLDRLGRNTMDIVRTVEALNARGVQLKMLMSPLDSRDPHGELMITMLAALAQYERRIINVRTNDGIARAKARGVKWGAKPKNTHAQILELHRMYGSKKPAWRAASLTKGGFMKALARAREAQKHEDVEDAT